MLDNDIHKTEIKPYPKSRGKPDAHFEGQIKEIEEKICYLKRCIEAIKKILIKED